MSDEAKPYTLEEFRCGDSDVTGTPYTSGDRHEFIGINKEEARRVVATVEALEKAEAESAGRLKALNEKAEEARREWLRAEKAEAERDELRRLQQVWLMSPEAAQRLDGYRQLAEKCAQLEAERDALYAALSEAGISHGGTVEGLEGRKR